MHLCLLRYKYNEKIYSNSWYCDEDNHVEYFKIQIFKKINDLTSSNPGCSDWIVHIGKVTEEYTPSIALIPIAKTAPEPEKPEIEI